jgi:hypothetical protein
MQDVHVKLKPELPWQKEGSTRRIITPANLTETSVESSEMLYLERSFYVAEKWTLRKIGDKYL